MTDKQINAAIAEACGWKWERIWTGELQGKPTGEQGPLRPIPEYCSDLNAMHEAERVLVNQFTTIEEAYWRNLQQVKPHPIYGTARQRAEAFLKTVGKWEAIDKESLTVRATTEESSAVQKEVQK